MNGLKRRIRQGGLVLAVLSVVSLGVCTLMWPKVTYWRARYWLGLGSRSAALSGVIRETSGGGWLELRHSLKSDNVLLRVGVAEELATRGCREGVRALVELCYSYPNGHLKFSPVAMLTDLVEGDMKLAQHASAEEWWHQRSGQLGYIEQGRWRIMD